MRVAVVATIAALSYGCAAGPGSGEGPGAPGHSRGDVAASMEVKISDSSVRMVLHVTNTSDRAIEFTFPTSQRYDFVVSTRSGQEVWRWSDGMSFLQAVSHARLAPGESWDMEAIWDPGSRTGLYVATGVLGARDQELRHTAAFELE